MNITNFSKFLIKVFITIFFIKIAINDVDINDAFKSFIQANIFFIFLAILFFGLQLLVSSYRWFLINKKIGINLPLTTTIYFSFIGLFFNQLLPSSIGGDAYKIIVISKRGISYFKSISSIFCDRYFGLFVTLILIFLSLYLFPSSIQINSNLMIFSILIFFLINILFLFFYNPQLKSLFSLFKNRLFKVFLHLSNNLYLIMTSFEILIKIVFFSLLVQSMLMLVFYFLSISIDAEISFYYFLASLPLVLLAAMLPISIAGWGVREAVFVFVFSFYGINKADLVLISVLFGLVNIFWSFFGLFLLLFRKKFF